MTENYQRYAAYYASKARSETGVNEVNNANVIQLQRRSAFLYESINKYRDSEIKTDKQYGAYLQRRAADMAKQARFEMQLRSN